MADHRVEQIIDAVKAAVTGLATTSANVERGRFQSVEGSKTAELTVTQGASSPAQEPNVAFQYPAIEVVITAHAKGQDGTVESTINQIAKEVYIAMMADRQLGLPEFVIDTEWLGNSEPSLSTMEKPTMSMEMRFSVQFQHSYTDPSA